MFVKLFVVKCQHSHLGSKILSIDENNIIVGAKHVPTIWYVGK